MNRERIEKIMFDAACELLQSDGTRQGMGVMPESVRDDLRVEIRRIIAKLSRSDVRELNRAGAYVIKRAYLDLVEADFMRHAAETRPN